MFYISLENIRKKYFNEKDLAQTLAENSQTEFIYIVTYSSP